MPEISTLGLTPIQEAAVASDSRIVALIKADSIAAMDELGEELPHPLNNRISGDAFDASGAPLCCIFLCARLGLLSHVKFLYDRASAEEKAAILSEGDCGLLRAALQASHDSRETIAVFGTLVRTLATKLAPRRVKEQEKKLMLPLLESGDFGPFRDALSCGDMKLAHHLVGEVFKTLSISRSDKLREPEKIAHILEIDDFKLFQELCRLQETTRVGITLFYLSKSAPQKIPSMLRSGEFDSSERTEFYIELLKKNKQQPFLSPEMTDMLLDLPTLTPLPDAIFKDFLRHYLKQNNPRLVLRLLSQYEYDMSAVVEPQGGAAAEPPKRDQSMASVIKTVNFALSHRSGLHSNLRKNLQLLHREKPESYLRLLYAVHLFRVMSPKVYSGLSAQPVSNVELLWKQIGPSVEAHIKGAKRAPLVLSRHQRREDKGLGTTSSILSRKP